MVYGTVRNGEASRRTLLASSSVWISSENGMLALGAKVSSSAGRRWQGGSRPGGGVFGRKCNLKQQQQKELIQSLVLLVVS